MITERKSARAAARWMLVTILLLGGATRAASQEVLPDPVPTVMLVSPTAALRAQGLQHIVDIQLLDQYGDPIGGRVNVDVTGANIRYGMPAFVGSDGSGKFAYTGDNVGLDTISLTADSGAIDFAQAEATVQWVSPSDVPPAPVPYTVSATPLWKVVETNTYHGLDISVMDQYGHRIKHQQVSVTRSGANPTSQPETAWPANDNYRYEYRGGNAGQDLITIEVPSAPGTVRAQTVVQWTAPVAVPLPSEPPIVPPGGLAGGAGSPGQVIAVSVNMKQAYLDSSTRRLHLAERMKVLKEKVVKDGMGKAPDVLLLQEIRRAQAVDVASRLTNHLPGTNYSVAVGEPSPYLADNPNYEIRADSVILINSKTMTVEATGSIDHGYTKEARATERSALPMGFPSTSTRTGRPTARNRSGNGHRTLC